MLLRTHVPSVIYHCLVGLNYSMDINTCLLLNIVLSNVFWCLDIFTPFFVSYLSRYISGLHAVLEVPYVLLHLMAIKVALESKQVK